MRGNWPELTFAQTSGIVTRDRGKIFGSSSLLASKMAKETLIERLRFTFTANGRFLVEKPRVSVRFEFRFESLKSISVLFFLSTS